VIVAALVALLTLAVPALALACPSCISSPYGDRSYNLAYLGLIATPFAVGVVIAGVFTRCWWVQRRRRAIDQQTDPLNEETT
jgi:hypothetical protein